MNFWIMLPSVQIGLIMYDTIYENHTHMCDNRIRKSIILIVTDQITEAFRWLVRLFSVAEY